jgi:1-phosphofructokinase family hexose kinase
MKKSILTVTVNPAVDVTTVVNGFSPGRAYRGCRQVISAGGKGINVSRVLNHLGVPTAALGIGGGAVGKLIIDLLNLEKIRNDFVRVGGMARINFTVLDVKNKRQTRVLSQGQELSTAQMGAFEKKYTQRLARSCAVVLSGRNIFKAPEDFYARLIRLAKKAKVPAVLDTIGESLREGIRAGPFMVKPNLEEAKEVLGCRLETLTQGKNAIKKFHRFGIAVAVLSMGNKGALASNGNEVLYAKPPSVETYSDVGCGDALVAGFLCAYLRRMSFAQTIQWAVAAGTVNAMNGIQGLIHLKDLVQLSQTITIRKI